MSVWALYPIHTISSLLSIHWGVPLYDSSDIGPDIGSCIGSDIGPDIGSCIGSDIGSCIGSYIGLDIGSSLILGHLWWPRRTTGRCTSRCPGRCASFIQWNTPVYGQKTYRVKRPSGQIYTPTFYTMAEIGFTRYLKRFYIRYEVAIDHVPILNYPIFFLLTLYSPYH